MIPQAHARGHPHPNLSRGGGRGARPAQNRPCGPIPPDRDRDAWYVADIDIDGARGPEREKAN